MRGMAAEVQARSALNKAKLNRAKLNKAKLNRAKLSTTNRYQAQEGKKGRGAQPARPGAAVVSSETPMWPLAVAPVDRSWERERAAVEEGANATATTTTNHAAFPASSIDAAVDVAAATAANDANDANDANGAAIAAVPSHLGGTPGSGSPHSPLSFEGIVNGGGKGGQGEGGGSSIYHHRVSGSGRDEAGLAKSSSGSRLKLRRDNSKGRKRQLAPLLTDGSSRYLGARQQQGQQQHVNNEGAEEVGDPLSMEASTLECMQATLAPLVLQVRSQPLNI
jgi:hypothetical protein